MKDKAKGSKKLLKVLNLSDLDTKLVASVADAMKILNTLNISGLMKYKTIERDESNLFRL